MKNKERNLADYPFEIRPLAPDEGGGYLISYPDFNECIADGETPEEAIADGKKALAAVIDTLEAEGLPVPEPGTFAAYSGKFVQRVPKSMHAQLRSRARIEGVSLNDLVITYIAGGLAGGHDVCSEGSVHYRSRKNEQGTSRAAEIRTSGTGSVKREAGSGRIRTTRKQQARKAR